MTTSHGPLYFDSTIDGLVTYTCDCGHETNEVETRVAALGLLSQHMNEMGEYA